MLSKFYAGLLILTLTSCNIFELISLPNELEEEEALIVETSTNNDIGVVKTNQHIYFL